MAESIPQNNFNTSSNHESRVSPETMTELNDVLASLLDKIPPRDAEEFDGGWSSRSYDNSFADGDHFVRVAGIVTYHDKFGIAQRPMLRIHRGTDTTGPNMSSDFDFYIEDTAVTGNETQTIAIDDSGKAILGADEKYLFADNTAIALRGHQLLEDVTFDGRETSVHSVAMPNLKVSPSGEIYEDGIEETAHIQLMSEAALTLVLSSQNDDDRRVHERRMAALDQARKDVGTELTEERAGVLIDTLTRLYPQLGKN
jgi:hypothetical protein